MHARKSFTFCDIWLKLFSFWSIYICQTSHAPKQFFMQMYIYSQAGNNVPDRLANAYGSFRRWCKNMHATPAVKHFTKENLGWTSMAKFPDCSFKGSDTRLLLGWLLNFMEEPNVVLDEVATNACVAAKAIDDFLRLCFGNKDAQGCRKILLTQEEAILCLSMLKVYRTNSPFLRGPASIRQNSFSIIRPNFTIWCTWRSTLNSKSFGRARTKKLCRQRALRRKWPKTRLVVLAELQEHVTQTQQVSGWPKSGSSLANSRGTTHEMLEKRSSAWASRGISFGILNFQLFTVGLLFLRCHFWNTKTSDNL